MHFFPLMQQEPAHISVVFSKTYFFLDRPKTAFKKIYEFEWKRVSGRCENEEEALHVCTHIMRLTIYV